MIVPEWNGSFPFTVKKLIDDSGYPSLFEDKDILLIGTSASSMSNIIGIEQLNYILQFVGANVYKKKVYIPYISKDMDVDLEVRLCKTIRKFFKKDFRKNLK
jgi:NAD(P)H-dependent FMN reductase